MTSYSPEKNVLMCRTFALIGAESTAIYLLVPQWQSVKGRSVPGWWQYEVGLCDNAHDSDQLQDHVHADIDPAAIRPLRQLHVQCTQRQIRLDVPIRHTT